MEDVSFGDFSDKEVGDLYTCTDNKLEFIWQRPPPCSPQSGDPTECTAGSLLTPDKHMLGGLSPNIPSNPPTSPVDADYERTKSPSKLNAYAMPFVPANVSIIVPPKNSSKSKNSTLSTSSTVSRKLYVGTTNEHPPDAKIDTRTDEKLSQTSDADDDMRDLKSSASEDTQKDTGDGVQTLGQHTSNSTVSTSDHEQTQSKPDHDDETVNFADVSAKISGKGSRRLVFQSLPPGTACSNASLLPVNTDTNNTNLSGRGERSSESTKEGESSSAQSPQFFTTPPPHPTHTSPPHTSTSMASSVSSPTPDQSNSPSTLTTGVPPNTTPGGVWGNKTKSWASVVGKQPSPGVTVSTGVSGTVQSESSKVNVGVPLLEGGDHVMNEERRSTQLRDLADQLSKWRLSHEPVCIQPRGLVNQGNWCYMHAPLQALLGCPGFYNLFRSLNNSFPALSREPSPSPISDTMVQFIREFKPYPKTGPTPSVPQPDPKSKKKRSGHKSELHHGNPFRPDCLYDMLHKIKSNLSFKGRQEDAEEFLGCILDGLHEEMMLARAALLTETETNDTQSEDQGPPSASSSEPGEGGEGVEREDVEWEQVGPKNKSTITRQMFFQESPITEIFGGELRSSVHRQKAKESATVEPFFSLQLDIQSNEIWSVKDALEALSIKETVHMSETEAHKRITLARLPPVLILHLKRFVFDKTGGSQKLLKQVQYSTEMEINKDLLSPAIRNKLSPHQRTYRLWAVVYHHGKTATGGHYTCDVHHPACGGWVRADDSLLKSVPEDFVLKPSGSAVNKVAYILFYRRLDTLRT